MLKGVGIQNSNTERRMHDEPAAHDLSDDSLAARRSLPSLSVGSQRGRVTEGAGKQAVVASAETRWRDGIPHAGPSQTIDEHDDGGATRMWRLTTSHL